MKLPNTKEWLLNISGRLSSNTAKSAEGDQITTRVINHFENNVFSKISYCTKLIVYTHKHKGASSGTNFSST